MFRIAPHLFNVTRYDGKKVAMGPSAFTTAYLEILILEDGSVYFPSIRKGDKVLKGRLYKYSLLCRRLQGRVFVHLEYDVHGICIVNSTVPGDYLFLHAMGEWALFSEMVADAL